MLDQLTVADFDALIGDKFEIKSQSSEISLKLVETKELRQSVRKKGAFSLLWLGPKESPLDQASYEFGHPKLENTGIFIVPVEETDDGIYYEAVFA